MKRYFNTPVIRYRLHPTLFLSSVLALAILAGCADEPFFGDSESAVIRFSVGEWNEVDEFRGRGGDLPATSSTAVFPIEGCSEADMLYLHAVTEPGRIDSCRIAPERNSRGVPAETTESHGSFGVIGFKAKKGGWGGTVKPDGMYDVKVVKSGAQWMPEATYFWPGKEWEMRFYGYAPHGAEGVSLSGKDKSGAPVITYTVPTSNPRQTDLFVGSTATVAGDGSQGAAMKFRHALTAVKFLQGSDLLPGTITKIQIKGVHNSGVCDMSSLEWTPGTTGNFSLTYTYPVDGSSGKDITYRSHTFFMIPQILPKGASIEINYTDSISNTSRVLTADIGGTEWKTGTTVSYRLSSKSISITPVLEVQGPADFSNLGGRLPFYVKSYTEVARVGDETKFVPRKWKAEFLEYNSSERRWVPLETRPEWITSFTESGDGGAEAKRYFCQTTVAEETLDYSMDEILKTRTEIPKVKPDYNDFDHSKRYNLSNPDGGPEIVNTANCYVVNRPGVYTLPLVYGNAIKNGVDNKSAYTSTMTGDTILSPFVNHLGNPISSPYIYENEGCTPHGAKTVWRDGHFTVTEARLSDNGQWLTFNVKPEYIKQSNAVLAILGTMNGKTTVLWSWHIWVTPYELGKGDKIVTNHFGTRTNFMRYNLGWCEYPAVYASRKIKVRITQTGENGLSREFFVNQNGASTIDGNCPLYQYGRKDALVPYERIGVSANKQWEANSGLLVSSDLPTSTFPDGIGCIAACIRQPNVFCLNEYMDGTFTNLWDSRIKTVYDPTPVGYIMPDQYVFTGFTSTGYESTDKSEFNVKGDYCNGWEFYCTPGGNGETIFFPANGGRRPESGIVSLNSPVYYRTGVNHKFERNYARCLIANDTLIIPNSSARKAWGYAIRPVREK